MGYAKKSDANQQEIVDAMRAVGATVEVTSRVGHDFPDVVAGINGFTLLIEIKDQNKKLTEGQKKFHATWRGHVCVVRSIDEALMLISEYRRKKHVVECGK